MRLKHGSCALGTPRNKLWPWKGEVEGMRGEESWLVGWSLHARNKSIYLSFLELCCPLSNVSCLPSKRTWLVDSPGETLRFVTEVFMSGRRERWRRWRSRLRRLSLFISCWRCVSSWWPACRRRDLCWCWPWRGNQSKDSNEINNKATWEEGLEHLWYGNAATFIQTPALTRSKKERKNKVCAVT